MKLTFVFTLFLVLVGAMMTSANCICPAVYDPVCGRNGVTYENECRLECAGVKLAYRGACGSGSVS